ncbi:MAG: class III extradiol dioxygenase subunit B-like domain-containing protein [Candidatus Nealsonbacteria bacterium]|nr:class III extradiol dioxygenase subunit B-like domain-containing protein [Candidatus Nealsonbacteria bacterium]
MPNIVFAALSPHPPIILPSVGSEEDRDQVKKTIKALEGLGELLKKENPEEIIISSPHPDWGFNVPLFFLARGFKGEIKNYLIGSESPDYYFLKGKEIGGELLSAKIKKRIALIASGDLSHRLKEDGPYGFNSDGPKFDEKLRELLKKKDIETILKLEEMYPEAAECGLRSFVFLLGILEGSKIKYNAEILSYEGPFGVGYLVAKFNF